MINMILELVLQTKYHRKRSDPKSNNVRVVDTDEQNFDDRSIWNSPDIAGIVRNEMECIDNK